MASNILAAPLSRTSVPLRASLGPGAFRAENRQERELLNLYRQLTPSVQSTVLRQAQSLALDVLKTN